MLSLKLTIQGSSENPRCSIVWIEPGSFKFKRLKQLENGNILSYVYFAANEYTLSYQVHISQLILLMESVLGNYKLCIDEKIP